MSDDSAAHAAAVLRTRHSCSARGIGDGIGEPFRFPPPLPYRRPLSSLSRSSAAPRCGRRFLFVAAQANRELLLN